jgi:membrane-bound hydrogenase subunit beta
MTKEEIIQNDLVKKFPFLEGNVRVQRVRRMYATVSYDKFKNVFESLIKDFGFILLCTITGLDEGTVFSLMYHMAKPDGTVLSIKTSAPKEKPVFETVSKYFPDADIYEREVMDLFGVTVTGLPPGKRYPLPDDWPEGQYPLRKDWKPAPKKGEVKDA